MLVTSLHALMTSCKSDQLRKKTYSYVLCIQQCIYFRVNGNMYEVKRRREKTLGLNSGSLA